MQPLHVAAASLNQIPLDWEGNGRRLRESLELARAQGVRLLCLPELALTGYGCEDAFLWPNTLERARRLLEDLLPETQGLIVGFGLPLSVEGRTYNAVAMVSDGELLGFAAKRHLAGEGLHYEPRWFRPWPKGKVVDLAWGDVRAPVGDLIFEIDGLRVGFEICEDAWVTERPGRELARSGVDVILNPSASHFAFGKQRVRRELVERGSREFGAAYIYANLVGNEAGRAIYDGDAWIASLGRIQASARRFSFSPVRLTSAWIDVDAERSRRVELVLGNAEGAPRHVARARSRAGVETRAAATTPQSSCSFEVVELSKEEEFARAVSLGLYDYLRKSRSRGFVVSLSGGADSATVAILVRLLTHLGISELGFEDFVESLGFLWGDERPRDEPDVMRRLLVTAYQSTDNSGEVTRRAASELAQALHAEHHEWSVQSLVADVSTHVERALGRSLSWERDDIALQNVQARVRSPSVWMLANVRGALLLSTSNRSEAAVGYATMDGDTSGGLSPIAGIDKAYLRSWLRFVERESIAGWGPLPALRAINEQAPTAELRPQERAQTDEKDLMPYEVLDAAERATVLERLPPKQVFLCLVRDFPEYSRDQLLLWTTRFFRLFARNQWKRERYAPSFHLDDASLDPKTWFRFPILSGGFEFELRELEREERALVSSGLTS